MGFFKSLGRVLKFAAKVILAPVCIPMAAIGTIVIGTARYIVDLVSAACSTWIKDFNSGKSVLFNANTALITASDGLYKALKFWNKMCFAGPKYCGSQICEGLEEYLNQSGFGSTGTADNDPNRDDDEDKAIKKGIDEYEKLMQKKLEKKLQVNPDIKGDGSFDKAKKKADEWLDDGKLLLARMNSKEGAEGGIKEEINKWLDRAERDKSIKVILHMSDHDLKSIIGGPVSGSDSSVRHSIQQARIFFSGENEAYSDEKGRNEIAGLLGKVNNALCSFIPPSNSPRNPNATTVGIGNAIGASKI